MLEVIIYYSKETCVCSLERDWQGELLRTHKHIEGHSALSLKFPAINNEYTLQTVDMDRNVSEEHAASIFRVEVVVLMQPGYIGTL
jgi:hypothetical protein